MILLRRVFQLLMRLYPAEHRRVFGAEMLAVFDRAAAERRAQGRAAVARFAFAEVMGVLHAAPAEWCACMRLPAAPLAAGVIAAALMHLMIYEQLLTDRHHMRIGSGIQRSVRR